MYRSKVKQIQQLLSQNPSFGLRDVMKPVAAQAQPAAAATAGKCKSVKRPSEEVNEVRLFCSSYSVAEFCLKPTVMHHALMCD